MRPEHPPRPRRLAGKRHGVALLVLGLLVLRLVAPLWHALGTQHICGLVGHGHSHGFSAACAAPLKPTPKAAHQQPQEAIPEGLQFQGTPVETAEDDCWLEAMEAPREALVHAHPPQLGGDLRGELTRPLSHWELIWAATRFGLAPCLSPPA